MITSAGGACDLARARAEPHTWWEIPHESDPCRLVGDDLDAAALRAPGELVPREADASGRPRLVAVRGAQVVENGGSLEVLDRVGAPGRGK